MKKLLLFTTGGVTAFALIFSLWNPFGDTDHVAIYKPRSAKAHSQPGFGAQGALEVQWEMKKNYFTGQIEYEDVLSTRRALKRHATKNSRANDMEWNTLGPDNIGGRTRALWINPNDDNHLIGGAVSGGLWETKNAGNTWEPVESFNKHEDFYQHMIIASIARTGSGIFYVGTGSQHEYFPWGGGGTAGFPGGGLWRSTDPSGQNWENVFTPTLFTTSSDWLTVDAVVVDPTDPEKMWIAHNRGLNAYYHGSDELEPRPSGIPQSFQACEDVHISHDGQVILASIGSQGYISTDGGESFSNFNGTTLGNGEMNPLGLGGNRRIEFAISPSDPNYLYAVCVNNDNSLRAVIASFDKGNSWHRIAQDVSQNPQTPFQPFGGVGGQGEWDCAIGVNPLNPKQIFLGGLVIYSHTISGDTPALANWEQRSLYSTNYTANPFAVHPDIHFFVWDSQNNFYAATDGGFFRSNDMATSSAPTFFPVNQGFVTTQFYGIAHSNDDRTIGGTQDNGTIYMNQEGVSPNQGIEQFGGDGFDCDISFIRPTLVFGSSQFGSVQRSLGGAFGENISPIGSSGDFTTNIRLVETEDDPYSTRGTMWGVDIEADAFNEQYLEWDNGDITLGYIPAGHWVQHNSVADQREFWTQLEQNMYYYQQKLIPDSTEVTVIDTVETIMDVIIDSVLVASDTTYLQDCDTFSLALDTTYVDSCTIFIGVEFCIHIDTILHYQDTLICVVTDTVIDYEAIYSYDTTYTYITETGTDLIVEFDTLYGFSDSLLLIDRVQSLFAVGLGLGQGVWVTRDALNTSIEPEYWNVGSNITDMINTLEWSPDRDHLYIGTASGRLLRISGFNQVYHAQDIGNLQTTTLINSGAPISDIAVDYSQGTGGPDAEPASEMVVVTRQQFGTTDKVLRSMNAASTTSNNSFSSIWNIEEPLNRMPVYTCVISKANPDHIVIGTEVGIFRTVDGGNTWAEENGGLMDRVPVVDLRQQYRDAWEVTNSGIIYAGTHGRGIFNNTSYFEQNTGVEDLTDVTNPDLFTNMTIYPNPVNTYGWVDFKLNRQENIKISIFNIHGQMVESINRDLMTKGDHQIRFDVNRMSAGTYILVLEAGGEMKSGRFIVTK